MGRWTAVFLGGALLVGAAVIWASGYRPLGEAAPSNSAPRVVDTQNQGAPTEVPAGAKVPIPEGLVVIRAERLLTFIKNYAGKGVLLNVWASWCGACKKELPKLMAMRKEYAQRGLDMMFVSVDELSEAEQALSFLTRYTQELPSFIAMPPIANFKAAIDPRWGGTLPATFLFDTTGRVRYFWATTAYEQELREVLDGFLEGRSIDGRSKVNVRVGEVR